MTGEQWVWHSSIQPEEVGVFGYMDEVAKPQLYKQRLEIDPYHITYKIKNKLWDFWFSKIVSMRLAVDWKSSDMNFGALYAPGSNVLVLNNRGVTIDNELVVASHLSSRAYGYREGMSVRRGVWWERVKDTDPIKLTWLVGYAEVPPAVFDQSVTITLALTGIFLSNKPRDVLPEEDGWELLPPAAWIRHSEP